MILVKRLKEKKKKEKEENNSTESDFTNPLHTLTEDTDESLEREKTSDQNNQDV